MGLYIEPPMGGRIQSKRDWLQAHGRQIQPSEATTLPKDQRAVFWQKAPWGDNAALGYDSAEVRRLIGGQVFTEVYAVPVESLRAIGQKI